MASPSTAEGTVPTKIGDQFTRLPYRLTLIFRNTRAIGSKECSSILEEQQYIRGACSAKHGCSSASRAQKSNRKG
jgi:hypothetical protein